MIRIDEIYSHTFWPYIKQHMSLTRMFFCDPPGRSDADSLFNHGHDIWETNYIFFHDQEPIHLEIHQVLFDEIVRRNTDLQHGHGPMHAALITSEQNSDFVDQVCSRYNWRHYYYFYHGWASLDWYRGYDRTFLIDAPEHRKIQHSFISPNRIVGGMRNHRLLLMYQLLHRGINNALISFPAICPHENQHVGDLVRPFQDQFSDIEQIFAEANLPWNFHGEQGHPMHSCWLSLFDECSQSLAYVVTETVFFGRRHHLTEKIFKPICLGMPFVLASSAGSLEYLRSYGFRTFGDIWDESYDQETDDYRRLEKIADLLAYLDRLDEHELDHVHRACLATVRHNFQHFYHGEFERRLWQEMNVMLETMTHDFRV